MEIKIPMAPAKAVPPLAPALASVVFVLMDVALRATFAAPVTLALFSIEATVLWSTMLSAKDAPTPRLDPLAASLGKARAVELVNEVAVRFRLAPLAMIEAAGSINERVLITFVAIANEPATPRSPAEVLSGLLGPEVASKTVVLLIVLLLILTLLPSSVVPLPTVDSTSILTV